MVRLVIGAAALFAPAWGQYYGYGYPLQPGQFGYDDTPTETSNGAWRNPTHLPSHDKCSVDCVRLCNDILGRSGRNANSYSDCQSACFAHSIETPHYSTGMWDKNRQQGKYVQKVMAEYCDRGVCSKKDEKKKAKEEKKKAKKGGLLQAEAVHKHEAKEGEVYSPGAAKGDPRAMPSGWPSGCESSTYYCQEFCQNIYHAATNDLGQHPGAGPNWAADQKQCNEDCNNNWKDMSAYWDEWCSCYEGPGGNMHLEKVPGLLQEPQEPEPVDVGSFMQTQSLDVAQVPKEL